MTMATPKPLSGGNPQIPKGYGDRPVQDYIAAVPGWKQQVCRRLDALIMKAAPKAMKAVKWNTPLYGMEVDHFFVGYHCFTHYVKVSFFRGAHLDPQPPGASKQKNVRYLDVREHDGIDEKQFIAWVKAASKLPNEKM